MRKTSAYARKRAHTIKTNQDVIDYKAKQLASLRTVVGRCTPYERHSERLVDDLMLRARMALDGFINRTIQVDDVDPHDHLLLILGQAKVRYIDITGGDSHPVLEAIDAAQEALGRAYKRWLDIGQWGLDGPAIQQLKDGIDLYEQVLPLSTPQQMSDASHAVVRWLQYQQKQLLKNDVKNAIESV